MNTIKLKEKPLRNIYQNEFVEDNSASKQLTNSKDIELYRSPEVLDRIHAEPTNALHILKQHNFESKVFCSADIHDYTSEFEVKCNRWNWVVTPVDIKNIEQIPYEFLEGINILLENNVNIDSVAIAKPKPKEDVFGVIKQELYYGLEKFSKIFIFILLLISESMRKAVKAINKAPKNVTSPSLIEIPDPVLLVRIQDKWIEIGRWI